ncbi:MULTISPECIES: hypothetical protein [unclassified Lentimicrobium]|uniref:hypothetical protein n=1 Tax=unclassified Lentimicrobium TaxID=2677434 RepID=UPI0015528C1A|nr:MULTISPECIES: hypothetical protein [unclassified Lentimicrobium]NPD44857.1 hypothetical protein [Lentimicrobium sp. S6]NPD86846.1 hypothetical protein [Lentimicrobium sp. L6]
MRKINVLILLMFCLIGTVYSQMNEGTALPNVLPSNPKAYEFMKYGEIPVGKYTGVPNISIPIYTINAKGLDIPIYLSYHSTGFKVNEEAGWTGLGWTLNAGGSITQVIQGYDDYGFYRHRSLPDFQEIEPNLPDGALAGCEPFWIAGTNHISHGGLLHPSYPEGVWDSEPDIFKFSFLDYSGSFILDWENEEFVCLSDPNILIESNYSAGGTPGDFTIIVSEGHHFVFLIKEVGTFISHYSESEEMGGGIGSNITDLVNHNEKSFRTYQLIQIITNQGDVIDYEYTNTDEVDGYPNISKHMYFYEPFLNSSDFQVLGINQFDILKTITASKQEYSYLTSIEFDGGYIKFNSTDDRLDIISALKLNSIELRKSKNNYVPVKTFNFEYDYFNGHSNGENLDSYLIETSIIKTNDELTKRLKLLSVQEVGKPTYEFEYFEENPLPKKTSLATDYWGYYNGVLINESLFPNIYRFGFPYNENSFYERIRYNNKSSSVEHTKSSVLKNIVYPTGGYTVFDYELNSFDNYYVPNIDDGEQGYLRIGPDLPQSLIEHGAAIFGETTFFEGSAQLSLWGCDWNDCDNSPHIRIYSYKDTEENGLLDAYINNGYGVMPTLNELGAQPGGDNYDAYIDQVIDITMDNPEPNAVEHFPDLEYEFKRGLVWVENVGGGCGYSPPSIASGAYLHLSYFDYGENNNLSFGSGLRVKKIESYNENDNLIGKNEFIYERGKLMSPLVYANKHTTPFHDEMLELVYDDPIIPCVEVCEERRVHAYKYNIYSASLTGISTSASGRYVGYTDVIEKNISTQNDENSTGYTVTTFSNEPDQSSLGSGIGFFSTNSVILPPERPSLENGLLLGEKYFQNDLENPISETVNLYQPGVINTCFYGARYSLIEKRFSFVDACRCFYETYNKWQIGAYPNKQRAKSLLTAKTEIHHFDDINSITKTVEYDYDDHHQLSYSKTINSNNDVVESFYKYPYDFYGISPFDDMRLRNKIRPIVEQEQKVNGQRIQLKRLDYIRKLSTYSFPIFPVKGYSEANGSSGPLELRVDYHEHDFKGNILEVSKSDDVHIVYLWGYNYQYPIAKIVNAEYIQDVKNAIGVDYEVLQQKSSSELEAIFHNLRNHPNLEGTQIWTYTYEPLKGMASETSPNEKTTTYTYDDLERLNIIKDFNDNIIEYIEYHYFEGN